MRLLQKLPPKIWVVAGACLVILALSISRYFQSYELLTYDFRLKLRPAQKVSSDIVIIEIADDTLKNLNTWPLPRDFHASLVDVLKEYGVRAIIFDILFNETTLQDDVFASAIKNAGNVYVASSFYLNEALKNRYPPTASKKLLTDIVPSFKGGVKGFGHINFFVDPDGAARSVPLYIRYKEELFPQLGFKAACDYLGLDCSRVVFKKHSIIVDGKLVLPLVDDGSFAVNYPATWIKSFTHLSYYEILKAYLDSKKGLHPELDLSLLKNKVCFIGLTATGTDLRAIPLEPVYPLVGLHASVFNSVIKRSFITSAGIFVNTLIVFLLFDFLCHPIVLTQGFLFTAYCCDSNLYFALTFPI